MKLLRNPSIFASQVAPPVSTTPAANFATSFGSVVDTGGKLATGINDTGGRRMREHYIYRLRRAYTSILWGGRFM